MKLTLLLFLCFFAPAAFAQNTALQWLQTLPNSALPDTIEQLDELDIISLRPKLDKQQLVELLAAIANKPTLFYGWTSTDTTLQRPLRRAQYNWQFLGKQQVDSIHTVIAFYITPDTGVMTWTMAQHQVAMICINPIQVVESVVLSDLYLRGGDGLHLVEWERLLGDQSTWRGRNCDGGFGGSLLLELKTDCYSTNLRIQDGVFTLDSTVRCSPFTHYQDPNTREALAFGCCGTICIVVYKSRIQLTSTQNRNIGYDNWKKSHILQSNFDSRVWVVQFPNSATTYTLTFSPDFERLTSRGSDGSAVQTFVHVPAY